MKFKKKDLYLSEYSKTISPGTHQYLSFFSDVSVIDEFEMLFNKVIENYGNRHFGIYRMCDAEYMYCVGRRMPLNLSLPRKAKYLIKSLLVNFGIVNQKTGHVNRLNKEVWFGENYSELEKKRQKSKFIADLKDLAKDGFLSPHLIYSPGKFAEEYIDPMLAYFKEVGIDIRPDNYFMFYYVYIMLSLPRYKQQLYLNRNVLVVTSFNERNKQENFKKSLDAEGVKNLYFYNISHDKAMLEIIDKSKLPTEVDLVLIGAGIGSINIINQLKHLNALCVDAGHALDCLSRPQLRKERIFSLPDTDFII